MRKFITMLAGVLFLLLRLSAQDLSYYLPDSVTYNPAIPTPQSVIYHQVGEWHVTHDRLVNYMQAIAAAAPDRVKLETMGFTYEQRPQVLLIISASKNLRKLESIRQQHVQLTDPAHSAALNTDTMPIVVYIGHSIHGNEPSGANASLLTAYYLAAAQGPQIGDLLDHVVILLDPSFNPDGLQRFSTWVNQHKSKNLVTDPASREYHEVWPGGRFNHYWFDLNRDWLPAQHVESRNRLRWFHAWKPNILTDHHEQGSNATFFFQPGVPSRVNPLTPPGNQALTGKLAAFHARYLDRIGSLYFTKESYDDFYYGKGSTYPDVNGAIGILFEQASSRGHAQETVNGVLRFPFTIKNQFTTALSTLEGARVLRKEFLDYQRRFYREAMQEATAAPVKGYVFGDPYDPDRTAAFVDMLLRHQIEVYHAGKTLQVAGDTFDKASSYVVPANQPQYRLIKAFFDKTLNYKDSIFYDITAWTMPLAFGLPYAELSAGDLSKGAPVTQAEWPQGILTGQSDYAYLLSWEDFEAPAALYALQDKGIRVKVSTRPFSISTGTDVTDFAPGTILVPVHLQPAGPDSLYHLLQAIVAQYAVKITAVSTGFSATGSDLGSRYFGSLDKLSVATVVGSGVSATDAGELWHLLDQRFDIPVSQLEASSVRRGALDRYTTIVLVGGYYGEVDKEALKEWVQGGGTLVLLENAVSWAAANGLSNVKLKRAERPNPQAPVRFMDREEVFGAQRMSGAIFGARMDLTHPMAYGYRRPVISLFKSNSVYMEHPASAYNMPLYYDDQPLQSGWLSAENKAAIKNTAAVIVDNMGRGHVINIADDPNFRAFWLGGSKLMMNALFFGSLM